MLNKIEKISLILFNWFAVERGAAEERLVEITKEKEKNEKNRLGEAFVSFFSLSILF